MVIRMVVVVVGGKLSPYMGRVNAPRVDRRSMALYSGCLPVSSPPFMSRTALAGGKQRNVSGYMVGQSLEQHVNYCLRTPVSLGTINCVLSAVVAFSLNSSVSCTYSSYLGTFVCQHPASDVFLIPCKGASSTINAYVLSLPLITIWNSPLQAFSILLSYCTTEP